MTVLAASTFVTACGGAADDGASTTIGISTSPTESDYCVAVATLARVLDDDGTLGEYDAALAAVVDESPADHTPTWALLLTLSEEPFSYDNFNPAVDSLDRLGPELDAACADLGDLIVDDDGRVRSYPTD